MPLLAPRQRALRMCPAPQELPRQNLAIRPEISFDPTDAKLDNGRVTQRKPAVIDTNTIASRILVVRGHKVMLDSDLAELYEVATKNLNTTVLRNQERFPVDFMFRVTEREYEDLRLQFAASKGRGGRRYLPYVFTEQGVAMLSSVLRSKRAALVNIEIMRTFAQLRQILSTHTELADKLRALENRYDRQFKIVFDAIRRLMSEPQPPKRRIGFTAGR